MKKLGLFASAVISGLALPASAFSPRQTPSDLARMRSDWVAVGQTMRAVIARKCPANAQAQTRNPAR